MLHSTRCVIVHYIINIIIYSRGGGAVSDSTLHTVCIDVAR